MRGRKHGFNKREFYTRKTNPHNIADGTGKSNGEVSGGIFGIGIAVGKPAIDGEGRNFVSRRIQ